MAVDGYQAINSDMYLRNHKKQERKTGQEVLGKDDFMKLLIAQLQNQDPTNPMKDTEFIAQMAQFSALEQTMNLSKSFEKFAEAQNQSQLIQYTSFVGNSIRWHELELDKNGNSVLDAAGKPVINEGVNRIESVKYDNGAVVFIMDNGKELTPGNISEVLASSASSNSLVEASMLIGKDVTYMDGDVELTAQVVSVSKKDGKLLYILDDGSKVENKDLIEIK